MAFVAGLGGSTTSLSDTEGVGMIDCRDGERGGVSGGAPGAEVEEPRESRVPRILVNPDAT